MTETFNKPGVYKADHTQFGGRIYASDFNTDYRGKSSIHGFAIAKRIALDRQFDRQCKRNAKINQKGGLYYGK